MDDVRQAYFDEVRERADLARSAKIGAYKRKRNKRYSKKELKSMDGQVYSVKLNTYMSHKEFMSLPDSLRAEYLQSIIDNWHVGSAAIGKMWDRAPTTILPLMKRLGVKGPSKRTDAETTKKFFDEFVGANKIPTEEVVVNAPTVETKK